MGDDYVRVVKNIAEEGTELLAYCLIAFAEFKNGSWHHEKEITVYRHQRCV